jgi:hypothetical protein
MKNSEYEHIISLLIAEVEEWQRSRSDEVKGTQTDVDSWFGKEESVNTTAPDSAPNSAALFWFNEGAKIAEDYDNLMDYHEGYEEEAHRIFQEDAQEIRELNDELNYYTEGFFNLQDYAARLENRLALRSNRRDYLEFNLQHQYS